MKTFIFIIIVVIISLNLQADQKIHHSNYWKKLLHFEKDNSEIANIEFFLADKSSQILETEFNTTVSLLKGLHGQEIACSYPARYTWLKSQMDLPDYNLSLCKELTKFLDSMQKDNVSLVFSSEYLNSPSSAFGHVLIIFKDQDISLELADVVHFAAETDNSGFIPYSYKGFSGKYFGYFQREKFFQKIYEYNTLEQRYMYIYTLDFDKDQILKILYHLYELRKAAFKYYFLDDNCASKVIDLLDMSNDAQRYNDKNSVLPIESIKRYKERIINAQTLIPFVDKIDYLIHKMNSEELKIFKRIIKYNEQPDNSNLSDIVKEALVYYSQFQFRKLHKSYKNYDAIMNLTYRPHKIKVDNLTPINNTKPSQIGLGGYRKKQKTGVSLHFRPVLSGLMDMPKNRLQESKLSVLETYIDIEDEKYHIEKLNILSMKSLAKQTNYYHPLSWQLYLGWNRKNVNQALDFETKVGLGVSKELFDNFSYSLLLSSGFEVGKSDFRLYLEPNVSLFYYPVKQLKIGTLSGYKQYLSDNFLYHNIFLSTEVEHLLFSLNYQKKKFNKKISLQVNYNF